VVPTSTSFHWVYSIHSVHLRRVALGSPRPIKRRSTRDRGCAVVWVRNSDYEITVNPKSAPVSVAEHYQTLLAERYSWMFGSFEQKAAEQEALFKRLSLHHDPKGAALDLGCGSGFQSVALARLGFEVTAVDLSERLLQELAQHRGSLPITSMQGDLRDLEKFPEESSQVVVCMGDTLTHLPARADIPELFRGIKRILKPGGKVIISFRDVNAELEGLDRFIPVKSDPDRIMTCVLEFEPETVLVTDLFYERTQSGWSFHKSSYRKIRIAPSAVAEELRRAGLMVTFRDIIAGFQILAAVKAE
jgi:ubiquinone/menaquinone biosynthesis C-methylase UbiE